MGLIQSLRHAYWNLLHWDFTFAWRLLRTVRLRSFVRCFWLFPVRRPGLAPTTTLGLRAGMDVVLRTYSSDPDVFKQVFIDRQYELPVPMERVRTLLDGGANVGLSTLYFLMRCPDAFVLAFEPDPENYRYAVVNTQVFASRVRMLPMALWSRDEQLDLVKGDAAWASSVRMSESPSLPVEGVSIAGALQLCGWSHVDLIKLDIEGAEIDILDAATPSTIQQAKYWAIELHSERARGRFKQLFRPPQWSIDTRGEISVATTVS